MRFKWIGIGLIALAVVPPVISAWEKANERQQRQTAIERREAKLEHIRSICHNQAVKNAETLYGTKRMNVESWRRDELMPAGMYFKEDYEWYYKECLRSYGIEE